ncbi:MAG: cysteine rich repeat-containing protein [Rhizobiaceae bacterium]
MKNRLSKLCCVGLLAAFGFGGIAVAQEIPLEKFNERMKEAADKAGLACGKEIDKFCATVNPGEGRIMLCMMAHSDQLSSECGNALLEGAILVGDASNFFQYAANACEADIEKNCANAEVGSGNIAACLKVNQAKVSPQCQEAVKIFQEKFE